MLKSVLTVLRIVGFNTLGDQSGFKKLSIKGTTTYDIHVPVGFFSCYLLCVSRL